MSEQIIEKSKERLEILEEIQRLEREGKFDVDPEKDPPTIMLMPDDIDYIKTKSTDKIKTKVAYKLAEKLLDELLKRNKLIIKDVKGLENLESVEGGAILTCNHFNPFDIFTLEKVFRQIFRVCTDFSLKIAIHFHLVQIKKQW